MSVPNYGLLHDNITLLYFVFLWDLSSVLSIISLSTDGLFQ